MQKIITRSLLLFVVFLIGLFVYRTIKPSNNVSAPAVTTVSQASSVEQDEKERVEKLVKEYLLDNPEIIIESIERFQKKKAQETEEKVSSYMKDKKAEIEDAKASPFFGKDNATTTIVAFYDYSCAYCKKGDDYLGQVLESDNDVRVVLRPFPILGEMSEYAAKIVLAVHKLYPDKFKDIHKGLIDMKPINEESVNNLLTKHEVDVAKIKEEIGKKEVLDIISENFELAKNLRIQGAPAYIIDGKLVPGLLEVAQIKQMIEESRQKPKEKVD